MTPVGQFWLISVGLLHNRFIGFDRGAVSSDQFQETFDDAIDLVGVQRTESSPEPLY
jgi:hypothetical protein